MCLESFLYEAKIETEVEVYGHFSHFIPACANDQEEALHFRRERQGLVPDFLVKLDLENGRKYTLVELKFISAGLSYYNSKEKQVDIRAKGLQQEYVRKCRNIDRKYCGAGPDEVGPLEQHLRGYRDLMGLVVGQYGEISQDLHDLVSHMADSKAKFLSYSRGKPMSENERSSVLSGIRRRLSVVAVRAQAQCLLARMGHLGVGAAQAAEHRSRVRGVADAERERQAHHEAYERENCVHPPCHICQPKFLTSSIGSEEKF